MISPTAPDRIDVYLDRLARQLQVDRRRIRRILTEAEDHLREAVQRGCDQGLTQDEAERRALEEFGSPRTVARRFAAEEGRLLPPSLLLHLVLALGLLGGVGMVAIGASGALAAAFGAAFGKPFVSGDTNGVTYTPARCADFRGYFPKEPDCEAAATAHHFDEVVSYRLAMGVLGGLVLLAAGIVRWRYRRLAGVRMLPAAFSATIGAALFGLATVLLLGQSLGQLVFSDHNGVGGLLSGGIIAALLCLYYTRTLLQTITSHDEALAHLPNAV